MPRFTGQNKKRINPRYFLNETMDPRLAAMMTLKPGAQVTLQTGEVAEIVDVIDPGQTFEVAIDGGDEERTITIHDIDMDQLRAPGDLREEGGIQEGDDVLYDGEVWQVKWMNEDGTVEIEKYVKDAAGGHSHSTAVHPEELELA